MLVLASASPRRQELLRNAAISFVVQPANINETPLAAEPPRECAERLAREKAFAVFQSRPRDWVLGADTIVVVDNMILGKPRDADDAVRMLRLLSARTHAVITGVSLIGPAISQSEPLVAGNRQPVAALEKTSSEITFVTMCELSGEEMRDYIETGEPMDKAGAYAIQG